MFKRKVEQLSRTVQNQYNNKIEKFYHENQLVYSNEQKNYRLLSEESEKRLRSYGNEIKPLVVNGYSLKKLFMSY